MAAIPVSKPTDLKRRRLIPDLRAAGMTYQAIADQLGVRWQAVQQSLRLSGNPRSVPIPCRKCLPRGAAFGERLKARRLAAGLTLNALSRLAGLHLHRAGDYEQGRMEPKWTALAKLIRVLGVDWLDVGAESRLHRRRGNAAR